MSNKLSILKFLSREPQPPIEAEEMGLIRSGINSIVASKAGRVALALALSGPLAIHGAKFLHETAWDVTGVDMDQSASEFEANKVALLEIMADVNMNVEAGQLENSQNLTQMRAQIEASRVAAEARHAERTARIEEINLFNADMRQFIDQLIEVETDEEFENWRQRMLAFLNSLPDRLHNVTMHAATFAYELIETNSGHIEEALSPILTGLSYLYTQLEIDLLDLQENFHELEAGFKDLKIQLQHIKTLIALVHHGVDTAAHTSTLLVFLITRYTFLLGLWFGLYKAAKATVDRAVAKSFMIPDNIALSAEQKKAKAKLARLEAANAKLEARNVAATKLLTEFASMVPEGANKASITSALNELQESQSQEAGENDAHQNQETQEEHEFEA